MQSGHSAQLPDAASGAWPLSPVLRVKENTVQTRGFHPAPRPPLGDELAWAQSCWPLGTRRALAGLPPATASNALSLHLVSSRGGGDQPVFHWLVLLSPEETDTELCSATLNLIEFKRGVPQFAPFMNFCTKFTPKDTRTNTCSIHCPHRGRIANGL